MVETIGTWVIAADYAEGDGRDASEFFTWVAVLHGRSYRSTALMGRVGRAKVNKWFHMYYVDGKQDVSTWPIPSESSPQ
jgi:hypothetical protein